VPAGGRRHANTLFRGVCPYVPREIPFHVLSTCAVSARGPLCVLRSLCARASTGTSAAV